jgi:hypothetical protein
MTVEKRFEFAPQDRISSLERWAPRCGRALVTTSSLAPRPFILTFPPG